MYQPLIVQQAANDTAYVSSAFTNAQCRSCNHLSLTIVSMGDFENLFLLALFHRPLPTIKRTIACIKFSPKWLMLDKFGSTFLSSLTEILTHEFFRFHKLLNCYFKKL